MHPSRDLKKAIECESGVQKRGPMWKRKSRNPCIYAIFQAERLNEITQRLKTRKNRLLKIESRGTLMCMGQGGGEEQAKMTEKKKETSEIGYKIKNPLLKDQ